MYKRPDLFVSLGAALVLASAPARGEPRDAELSDVTLNGDNATIAGSIDVSSTTSGTFLFHIKRTEVRGGELVLSGPLTAAFGRGTQTLAGVTMRLSDGDGICERAAVTSSPLNLRRLGLMVDSMAVDVAMSAASASGRVLANLLCSTTHLLDEPGPLSSAVGTLSQLANKSLARPMSSRTTVDQVTIVRGKLRNSNPDAYRPPQAPQLVDPQAQPIQVRPQRARPLPPPQQPQLYDEDGLMEP